MFCVIFIVLLHALLVTIGQMSHPVDQEFVMIYTVSTDLNGFIL